MLVPARFLALAAVCVAFMGCAHNKLVPNGQNYRFGKGWHADEVAAEEVIGAPPEAVVEEGKPHLLLDAAGWTLGIPSKILLWDRRVKNHRVSPQTRDAVAEYVERNGMTDICVRVNQYAPLEEWRRLCDNREIGWGWRYTVGAMGVAGYTLFPGRLFGRDRYNPYTNSLYIYSDIPSLGIQSAAYAKDLRTRSHPGTYAFVNELPVLGMWRETIATQDALDYVAATGDRQAREESLVILYPHYGLLAGGTVESVLLGSPLIPLGGLMLGHLSGRASALVLPDDAADAGEGAELSSNILQTAQNPANETAADQGAAKKK